MKGMKTKKEYPDRFICDDDKVIKNDAVNSKIISSLLCFFIIPIEYFQKLVLWIEIFRIVSKINDRTTTKIMSKTSVILIDR